ncbi:hypothetical protein M0R45_006547 [Rubus argutus]|uniref:Uncharacterized protein n=1 Tax=Rubus argutus TaxID=59490 RepID=A0AAW1YQX9_RUBAR
MDGLRWQLVASATVRGSSNVGLDLGKLEFDLDGDDGGDEIVMGLIWRRGDEWRGDNFVVVIVVKWKWCEIGYGVVV